MVALPKSLSLYKRTWRYGDDCLTTARREAGPNVLASPERRQAGPIDQ